LGSLANNIVLESIGQNKLFFCFTNIGQVQFIHKLNKLLFKLIVVVAFDNFVYPVAPVGMLCTSLSFLKLGALVLSRGNPVVHEVLFYRR
jgi:hypothetical protein